MRFLVLPLLMIGLTIMTGCRQTTESAGGPSGGGLRPCPDSPNCVSSLASTQQHRIDPLRYAGTKEQAREALLTIIRSMERSTVVTASPDYIRAEFRSPVFQFVDDAEFLLDDAVGLIHFRSAARTGYYDFNVNRKRMEEIRKRFSGPG